MKQLTHKSRPHSFDWDAKASEALEQAKKLPPGPKRSEAIKKAGQLRVAADMRKLLMPKAPLA
jgi:hypothetical protein